MALLLEMAEAQRHGRPIPGLMMPSAATPAVPRDRRVIGTFLVAVGLGAVALVIFMNRQPTPPPVPTLLPEQTRQLELAEVDRLLQREEWTQALLAIDRALATQPTDGELRARRQRTETEVTNRSRYESLKSAVERHQTATALGLYEGFAADSVYRLRADLLGQRLREGYLAAALAGEPTARTPAFCEEVRQVTTLVPELDPDNGANRALLRHCSAVGGAPDAMASDATPAADPVSAAPAAAAVPDHPPADRAASAGTPGAPRTTAAAPPPVRQPNPGAPGVRPSAMPSRPATPGGPKPQPAPPARGPGKPLPELKDPFR